MTFSTSFKNGQIKVNDHVLLFYNGRNLQAAEDNMIRLSTGLNDVDHQVALLREQLSISTREVSEIEIGLNKARQTLSASQDLVLELADEYDRWRNQVCWLLTTTNLINR